ncbi:MAG: Regulatory protein AtoC [Ignavibacteria bacterium]|nr:Regulatory protein AtoC [Ignavibacteria bacterium]
MNEGLKILVVDDEVNSTRLMKKILQQYDYDVTEENSSIAAKDLILQNGFDIVISDLQMPDLSGLDLLKASPPDILFILVTGYGSVDSAVESMKNGAFDYINKPFSREEFVFKVSKAVENLNLRKQLARLKSHVGENYSFGNIIGKSKRMQNIFDLIKNVAKTNVNVLLEGQSGTGKELVSRSIHLNSKRREGPFVAINCSAIPDSLLESELFGHVKGAFTGATDTQKGVFEQAHGGTLLLDEIAEMPYNLQSKLLRVIENWEIKPLGSDKIKTVDVRLISATNQNLHELINQKKFREDLFYRISTVMISLPSLNERREDIPHLINFILKKISADLNKSISIDAEAVELLIKHDWKGNVRELENILERAAISFSGDKLKKIDFKFLKTDDQRKDDTFISLEYENLKKMEKEIILNALNENKWNKAKTSLKLGLDRKTLYKKIKEYNLEVEG